jgi:diacylglycerol kinase (ATP)
VTFASGDRRIVASGTLHDGHSMTTRTPALFLNPIAGRGRARRHLPRILELMEAAGTHAAVHQSTGVGDLEIQVWEAVRNGATELIVAGGDGSVHEAVNGIMAAGGDAALGVIPVGTGNDFAKAAGIPLDWEAATTLLARRVADGAHPRSMDLGRMNDRWFANGAGIGLDAKVTQIARSYRWPIGDLVYLAAIFHAMLDGIATPEILIESDELQWDGPLTLANVSNGPWIGGMFHIAPMAKNDDGLLELLVAAPVTRMRILQLLPKLMRGDHMDEREIVHASVRRVKIAAAAAVPSHLDGEMQPLQADFEIEILPDGLQLL